MRTPISRHLRCSHIYCTSVLFISRVHSKIIIIHKLNSNFVYCCCCYCWLAGWLAAVALLLTFSHSFNPMFVDRTRCPIALTAHMFEGDFELWFSIDLYWTERTKKGTLINPFTVIGIFQIHTRTRRRRRRRKSRSEWERAAHIDLYTWHRTKIKFVESRKRKRHCMSLVWISFEYGEFRTNQIHWRLALNIKLDLKNERHYYWPITISHVCHRTEGSILTRNLFVFLFI